MPIGDVATPWIRPAQGPEFFTKGYQIGTQQAEAQARLQAAANAEQARLNQEAQKEQLNAFLAQEKLQQDARLEQQRIEVGKQYHLAQIGLNMERVKQSQAQTALRWQEMASKQSAEERIKQRIASGENEYKVILEEGAGAGLGGTAMVNAATALRQGEPGTGAIKTSPVLHPITGQPMEGVYGTRSSTGAPIVRNQPLDQSVLRRQSIRERTLRTELANKTKLLAGWRYQTALRSDPAAIRDKATRDRVEQDKKQAQFLENRIKDIEDQLAKMGGVPEPADEEEAAPDEETSTEEPLQTIGKFKIRSVR